MRNLVLILLAATLLTSTLGTLVSAAPPTDQASCEAANGTWRSNGHSTICDFTMNSNTKPELRAQAYSYYHVALRCVSDGVMNDHIRTIAGAGGTTEPSQGDKNLQAGSATGSSKYAYEWFHDWNADGIAYPDGKLDCYQVMQKLLDMTGFTGQQALQAMGWTFHANVPEWTGPADRGAGLRSFIFSQLGNLDQLNDNASKYPLYLNAFTNSTFGQCQGTQVTTYANADATLQQWVKNGAGTDNNLYAKLTLADGTTPTDYVYKYAPNSGSTGAGKFSNPGKNVYGTTWNYQSTFTTGSNNAEAYSCSDLVSKINSTVADYISWYVKNNKIPPVQVAGNTDKCSNDPNSAACKADTKSTCGISGIGWLVCPVMSFMASISDNAFSFLSTTFLETKSSTLADPSVQAVWSAMRNIANVAFVIAFIIIIFSQLTGQGVSNYGVKKMLPRLVVAAILVNLSFFICQVAVDLSNILGYSLNSVLSNSYAHIGGDVSGQGDASSNGLGIAVIVAGILAGAVTLALAVTFPVIIAVVIALIMIVLILVARTALIILLAIISPLAFVAYLLPNTEQWFKKWYKMYFALLMVFPIIAIVFGASTLAARVINTAATADPSHPDLMMQIVAIGVAALPLFVVPSLLKGSLNAAGSIGTKLSNWSSKANGRISGKVKDTSKLGQLQKYRAQQRQIRRAQMLGGTFKGTNKNPLNWGRNASSWMNNQVNQRTGKFGTEQSRLGERINAKIEAEEVTAAKATIDKLGLSLSQLAQLAKGQSITHEGRTIKSDSATQKAAISSVIQTGDHDNTRELIDSIGNSSSTELRAHLADSLASSSARPGYIGGAALGAIRTGTGVNSVDLAKAAIQAGSYSAEKIAKGDKDELAFIARTANSLTSEPNYAVDYLPGHQRLVDNANKALTDRELSLVVGKNRGNIEHIRSNTTP